MALAESEWSVQGQVIRDMQNCQAGRRRRRLSNVHRLGNIRYSYYGHGAGISAVAGEIDWILE